MKLKYRIYKKLSKFFNSDNVDVEQELEVAEKEESVQNPPKVQVDYTSTDEGQIMMAVRDAISATPIEKLHWHSVDEKEKAYIKHIEGLFSLNKEDKFWKLEIILNENSIYNRKLTSDEYVKLIYRDLYDRVDDYVIDYLKQKTKNQTEAGEENA